MENLPEFKSNRETPPLAENTTLSTSDDGSHLDSIRMPDLEDAGHDPDAPIAVDEHGVDIPSEEYPAVEIEQVSRDGFYELFKVGFSAPAMVMPDFKSVAIQDGEEDAARQASDALYSLLEIYYPAALVPSSETFAHLFVLGSFLVGKVMIVRAILAARAAPPPKKAKPDEADVVDEMPPTPPTGDNVVSAFAPDWGHQ